MPGVRTCNEFSIDNSYQLKIHPISNMSRIGKKPIEIPEGVEVNINGQEVNIKGPKGEIKQSIPAGVLVKKENGMINVSLARDRASKKDLALWGLTRALLQNNVKGVREGFEKKLEIRGIGYKAALEDKCVSLEVGFSHSVKLEIPEGIDVSIAKELITVSGIDKYKVGQFAANIRKIRPPEPYKGKGVRYLEEKVRKKEGKKAGTT